MKAIVLYFVMALVLGSVGQVMASGPFTVDPDAFPSGTVITNAFPGVTLTTRDGLAPGTNPRDVLAMADSNATTGANVFAQDNGDPTWGDGIWEYLQVDFADGATLVSLDFFANDGDGDSNAELLAFDASNNLVDSDSVSFVPFGSFATLTVSAPNIAYVAAYWDELTRTENGGLDYLTYTTPGPLTSSVWQTIIRFPGGDDVLSARLVTRMSFNPRDIGDTGLRDDRKWHGTFSVEHFGTGKYYSTTAAGKVIWTGYIWDDSNEDPDEPKYIFNGNWRYVNGSRWMAGYIFDGDHTGELKRFIAKLISYD